MSRLCIRGLVAAAAFVALAWLAPQPAAGPGAAGQFLAVVEAAGAGGGSRRGR